MTWESFYFICFLVGLFLSAFTLLGGMGRIGGHFHFHLPQPMRPAICQAMRRRTRLAAPREMPRTTFPGGTPSH